MKELTIPIDEVTIIQSDSGMDHVIFDFNSVMARNVLDDTVGSKLAVEVFGNKLSFEIRISKGYGPGLAKRLGFDDNEIRIIRH